MTNSKTAKLYKNLDLHKLNKYLRTHSLNSDELHETLLLNPTKFKKNNPKDCKWGYFYIVKNIYLVVDLFEKE